MHTPDLGVVAGTYVLKPSVFTLPRLGSINLHTGKTPEYRGSAPAFWELYNGEDEVGITIHQVEATLDAGQVYSQKMLPLDPAPPGDPMRYVEHFRDETLIPRGIELLTRTVDEILSGTATGVPQDPARAKTYPYPDHRAVQELRRRVRSRR